jgi:hypothetical protein
VAITLGGSARAGGGGPQLWLPEEPEPERSAEPIGHPVTAERVHPAGLTRYKVTPCGGTGELIVLPLLVIVCVQRLSSR